MKTESLVFIIVAVIAVVRFFIQIYNTTSGDILTGPATVVSKRVQQGNYHASRRNAKSLYVRSSWNYLVTFRLSDGEEIELHTFEEEFQRLEEGMHGQLRWHKNNMTDFLPEEA